MSTCITLQSLCTDNNIKLQEI